MLLTRVVRLVLLVTPATVEIEPAHRGSAVVSRERLGRGVVVIEVSIRDRIPYRSLDVPSVDNYRSASTHANLLAVVD